MPLTVPPTPPSRNNPATFSEDADTFLAWFPDFVTDYNNDFIYSGRGYCDSVGGTANAITLTGVLPSGAGGPIPGQKVSFLAATANTGAATLNLDGTGAYTIYTARGTALPAGYLRTDQITELTFDMILGGWIARRGVERGSNANGDWVRFEDGTQICTHLITVTAANVASGALWTSNQEDWTFPVAFSTTAGLTVTGAVIAALRWCNCSGVTTTVGSFRQWAAASNAATPNARVQAIGRWY